MHMLAKIHYAHVPPLTCIYHIPDTLARVSALGPSVHAHPSKPPVHCCVRVPQGTVHAARSTRSEILGEKSCRCVCLFVSAHVCLQCMQTVKASGDKGRSPQYRCARINGMDGKRTLPVFPWFVFTQQQLPTPACCKIHII